jgi:hypothetical protein
MKSRTTRKFWRLFDALPIDIQEQARRSYRQFRDNPAHPGLSFKRVSTVEPVYSVRIGVTYRAAGLLESDTVTWFWIGPHDAYDRLLRA